MARTEFRDIDQIQKDYIDYWLDLIAEDLDCFCDLESVRAMVKRMRDNDSLNIISIQNTGVFAYCIAPDFLGDRMLSEIIFYIRKEDRGDLRLVKRYINLVEEIAEREHCRGIAIGGNINYKDSAFLKLLKRWGYVDHTVAKYLTD